MKAEQVLKSESGDEILLPLDSKINGKLHHQKIIQSSFASSGYYIVHSSYHYLERVLLVAFSSNTLFSARFDI